VALYSKYTRTLTFENFVLTSENFGAALISRGESTGGIPRRTGIGCHAARKWLVHVEQNGEWQQLRLAAREGLYALEGKSFSYEAEVQKENERARHLLEKRRNISEEHFYIYEPSQVVNLEEITSNMEEITSNIRVGDIVEFSGLMNAQSQYNDQRGEVTGLEVNRSGQISDVWVKLPDEVQRLAVKVHPSSCTIVLHGLTIGDYVQLHSLPKFQAKYSDLTGVCIEIIRDNYSRVVKVRVKLPDLVRKYALLVPKASVTLVRKEVRAQDKVVLKFLPPSLAKFEGITGHVVRKLKMKGHVEQVEVQLPEIIRPGAVECEAACVFPLELFIDRKDDEQFSKIKGSMKLKAALSMAKMAKITKQEPLGVWKDLHLLKISEELVDLGLLENSESLKDPREEAFPTCDEDVAKGTKQQSSCDLGKQQLSCGLGQQEPDDPGGAVSNRDEDVEVVWDVLQELLSQVGQGAADTSTSAISRSTSVSFEYYAEKVLEKRVESAPQTPRAPEEEFTAGQGGIPLVDESRGGDFWSFVSANAALRYGARTVGIRGMLLHGKQETKNYTGIIGDFQRSEHICNGKAVYMHSSQPSALWWTNIDGDVSWCVGPKDRVGSSSMWAYVKTDGLGPEHADKKPWYVYSYKSQVFEMQTGVEVVNLDKQAEREAQVRTLRTLLRALPSVVSWWVHTPSFFRLDAEDRHAQDPDGHRDSLELFVINEAVDESLDPMSRPLSASERPSLPTSQYTSRSDRQARPMSPEGWIAMEDRNVSGFGPLIAALEMEFRACLDALASSQKSA
jgi:hypothetical protein